MDAFDASEMQEEQERLLRIAQLANSCYSCGGSAAAPAPASSSASAVPRSAPPRPAAGEFQRALASRSSPRAATTAAVLEAAPARRRKGKGKAKGGGGGKLSARVHRPPMPAHAVSAWHSAQGESA